MWKQRNLSIIEKIQIIKTYGTSQLIFITNMLSVSLDILKQANIILPFFFVEWSRQSKTNAMIADYDKGGLKMLHIESIIKTQKIMRAKRFIGFNFHHWKEFLNIGLNRMCMNSIMNRALPEKKT